MLPCRGSCVARPPVARSRPARLATARGFVAYSRCSACARRRRVGCDTLNGDPVTLGPGACVRASGGTVLGSWRPSRGVRGAAVTATSWGGGRVDDHGGRGGGPLQARRQMRCRMVVARTRTHREGILTPGRRRGQRPAAPPWPRDAPAAAGQHSFAAPRPVRCFAVGWPRLHAGAGLTLRPTAPSKVLLEHPSRNTFAVCACDGVCGCGGSLRTGFPRGPEDAISTIPSRATPVLLARLWVWRVRRQPRTGRGGADTMVVAGVTDRATGRGRASVVERVDGPTLTGCVEGAGALATACRRTAATRGSARPTACASSGAGS